MSNKPARSLTKSISLDSSLPVYTIMVGIWMISLIIIPGFRTVNRTMQLLQTASFLAIVAAGQTISVITNGIDYSVSGTITAAACICGALIKSNYNLIVAIAITLAVCAAIGFFNSLGINYLKMPTLIMTIASVSIIEGLILIGTGGFATNGQSPILRSIGKDKLFGTIPYMILVCAAIYLILYWFLHKTKHGRLFYFVSTSQKVSELSGLAIKRVRLRAMLISSLLAGLMGILLYSYLGYNYLTLGKDYHIQTLAAVVLGGTAITGGRGRIVSTIAGSIIFVIIYDTLSAINISQALREMIQGLLIIGMLLLYARERQQK